MTGSPPSLFRVESVLAAQIGANGCIVKPFTKATLEEKLTKIVQKMNGSV